MRKNFNRSEQKFWVLRRGDIWSIMDSKTNEKVGEITPDEANSIEVEICLCDSIEEIRASVSQAKI